MFCNSHFSPCCSQGVRLCGSGFEVYHVRLCGLMGREQVSQDTPSHGAGVRDGCAGGMLSAIKEGLVISATAVESVVGRGRGWASLTG